MKRLTTPASPRCGDGAYCLYEVCERRTDFIYVELRDNGGRPSVAKYRALFRRLFQRLADFPDSGAPRPKLGADIRIGVVSPSVVVYRYVKVTDTVYVLRLAHGKRKVTRKMLLREQ
jgi:toxin ParE1/3/4